MRTGFMSPINFIINPLPRDRGNKQVQKTRVTPYEWPMWFWGQLWLSGCRRDVGFLPTILGHFHFL